VAAVAQNVYDDAAFFAAYAQLPRSVHGLDAAPEWPALQAMLPPLPGAHVVDLGCGYGWFCRWAAQAGAAAVRGIDLSERMLARARADTDDPRIAYERQDLDDVRLPPAAFDLAYSSLTLHYLTDLERFLARVHAALVPGGALVFSCEHPIATAPSRPAFTTTAEGRTAWPLDRYLDEGPRTTDWLAPGVVKQHRTIASYVDALLGAGFTLTRLVEWGPSPEQVAEHPEWAPEVERPPFLLAAARAGRHSESASGSTRR
jgi:SAM-dependent methyltransferase